MSVNRINFTKKLLDALPVSNRGKRTYFNDTGERGLQLCITDKGYKSFYLYKKIEGKPTRTFIGKYPDCSIDQARKKSQKIKGEIAKGKNPHEERRKMSQEITLGILFKEYMEKHAIPHKKSWKEDERQYNYFLTKWENKRISQISKSDIVKLLTDTAQNSGTYSSNRLLSLLSILFNKAIEWGWDGQNPTNRIKKFKEKSRDRFLQPEELPRFFEALSEEENTTARDFILVALLTGARKTNVLTMRWEEISFSREIWRIPETKNGEAQLISLSPQALSILESRKKDSDSEWVFPGTGKAGYLNDPKKAWQRILERAEIKDLRLHDLRRTLGSWQAATGATTAVIGKSLGHKSPAATAIYARLNLDPVRDSVNTATDAIFAAAGIVNINDDFLEESD